MRSTNEKITGEYTHMPHGMADGVERLEERAMLTVDVRADKARGLFEKATGKNVPDKVSN